jgi:shikimate kinase
LTGKATAIAHGAATIVNAMATGKGAAFGVDLWTKAEVKLTDQPTIIQAEITSDPTESTLLIESTVKRVLEHFALDKSFGAKVKTRSNIPIARGLKSSSTAANAVALATTAALGKTLDDLEIVKIGVEAAFDAKVTLTGAFDDAYASYFGGIVVTDNLNREVVKELPFNEDLQVLFHVPAKKAYSANADLARLQTLKPLVEVVYGQALEGRVWEALSLNGLIYSAALGYDAKIAFDALEAGAVAAGLCGKGPAVTAITPKEKVNSVKAALQKHGGEVLEAKLNREKAKVI